MSSHHFVKENQEPALLILSAMAIPFERVQELLEWSPTVIVADHELDYVLGWGVKIDIVICLAVRVDYLKESLADQEPLEFITYDTEKETIAVYHFLSDAKYKAVNILLDQISQLSEIQLFTSMDVEAFCHNQRWVFIQSTRFEKWVAKGTQFFVYPDTLTSQIEVNGLSASMVSLDDGVVTIHGQCAFWLGEQLQ
jgi:thiamine pyrophosphokinase